MSDARHFFHDLTLFLDCLSHCEITVNDETVSIHPREDYYYQRGNRLDVADGLVELLRKINDAWEGEAK